MNKEEDNKIISLSKYAIVSLISLLAGGLLMYLFCNSGANKVAISSDKYKILDEVTSILDKEYYKKVDKDKLLDGAISGLVDSIGDKHTSYFTPKEAEEFKQSLSDSYYGIGAVIFKSKEGEITVRRVFDDSPAKRAGIQIGDIILSIDGKSTEGMEVDKVASTLKSNKSSKAKLVIKRNGEELTVEIVKSTVPLKSVSAEMLDDNIGYVIVDMFGESTYQEFSAALNDLESKGMKSLIIDLRDNGGGYLSTVLYMASEFLDPSKVVVQTREADGTPSKEYHAVSNTTKNYKVVVLINENSASASEIMTAALKEQYGATIVGKKSYGKGTVQLTKNLSNGGMLKYTTEEWLTSNGNSINEVGIEPDIEVDMGEEYLDNPLDKKNDAQLQRAIEAAK